MKTKILTAAVLCLALTHCGVGGSQGSDGGAAAVAKGTDPGQPLFHIHGRVESSSVVTTVTKARGALVWGSDMGLPTFQESAELASTLPAEFQLDVYSVPTVGETVDDSDPNAGSVSYGALLAYEDVNGNNTLDAQNAGGGTLDFSPDFLFGYDTREQVVYLPKTLDPNNGNVKGFFFNPASWTAGWHIALQCALGGDQSKRMNKVLPDGTIPSIGTFAPTQQMEILFGFNYFPDFPNC